MSITQFAMVEELASLVKDNYPCKHLVLSAEDALVAFLQDYTSSDGVLKLEPMNPYHRLLLHRVAEIFGFGHESVGEGDDRHLILERYPETSIPPILVRDILGQYDDCQSPSVSHKLLRRESCPPVLMINSPWCAHSTEEKELAYLAARRQIFSVDMDKIADPLERQKPRSSPVVAKRMIAHALGHRRIDKQKPNVSREFEVEEANELDTNSDAAGERNNISEVAKECRRKVGVAQNDINNNLKAQHTGAAKRMFANALGLNIKTSNKMDGRFVLDE